MSARSRRWAFFTNSDIELAIGTEMDRAAVVIGRAAQII